MEQQKRQKKKTTTQDIHSFTHSIYLSNTHIPTHTHTQTLIVQIILYELVCVLQIIMEILFDLMQYRKRAVCNPEVRTSALSRKQNNCTERWQKRLNER